MTNQIFCGKIINKYKILDCKTEVKELAETISPLRYPGGKSKLAPLVRYIVENKTTNKINTYIEPFAGGAGVALDLLINGSVENIIINDYDKSIYSFWKAVLTESERFIQTIRLTPVNITEWQRQKKIYSTYNDRYSFELGFATFFLNRTNRSGILSAGPIGGYDQTGNYLLDVRFNKEKLINRIEKIAKYRSHIKVYNKDIRSFIRLVIVKNQENSFVYFDPPYFSKGKELYINYFVAEDHAEIRDAIIHNVRCQWIITYDDEKSISSLYDGYTQRTYDLSYSLANKGIASELIIFSEEELCPNNTELIQAGVKTILS